MIPHKSRRRQSEHSNKHASNADHWPLRNLDGVLMNCPKIMERGVGENIVSYKNVFGYQ
jgi:hypothetical protein